MTSATDTTVSLRDSVRNCALRLERHIELRLRDKESASRARALSDLGRLGGYCQFADVPSVAPYCNEIRLLWNSLCRDSTPDQAEIGTRLLCLSILRLTAICKRIVSTEGDAALREVNAEFINELRVANGKKAFVALTDSAEVKSSGHRVMCIREARDNALDCLLRAVTNTAALLNTIAEVSSIESGSELRKALIAIDSIACMLSIDNSPALYHGLTITSDCPQKVAHALVVLEFRLMHVKHYNNWSWVLTNTQQCDTAEFISALPRMRLVAILQDKLKDIIEFNCSVQNDGSALLSASSEGRTFIRVATDIVLFSRRVILVLNNFSPYRQHKGAVKQFMAIERFFRNFLTLWEILVRNADGESPNQGLIACTREIFVGQLARAEWALEGNKKMRKTGVEISNIADAIDRRCACLEIDLRKCIALDLQLHDVSQPIIERIGNERAALTTHISRCLKAWTVQPGIHYIGEAVCTAFYKLSMALLLSNQIVIFQTVISLHGIFTMAFERQSRADRNFIAIVECLVEVLREVEFFSKLSDASQTRKLRVLDDMISCAAAFQPAVEESAMLSVAVIEQQAARLPIYLARSIRKLLIAPESLRECLLNAETFETLSRQLVFELRTLATGARELRVYRIERLSSVLAEVHQHLAVVTKDAADEIPVDLLTLAHECLRSGLNQAAARQEVGNPREIIASLYRWLEDNSNLHDRFDYPLHFSREVEEIMSRLERNSARFLGADSSNENCIESRASVLRDLHTLKGNAGFFDWDRIATLCHRCEAALLAEDEITIPSLTVAEYVEGGTYVTGSEVGRGLCTWKTMFAEIFGELRSAVDALIDVTWRKTSIALAPESGLQALPIIPVVNPENGSVTIHAQALQRIAELASLSRTVNRSARDVLQSLRDGDDIAELTLLAELLEEQDRCAAQLYEEIDGSKTVSFARVSPRLHRLAGRFANLLDKQVQLNINNHDLRMDRALVERLVAPLEHLLRNAIDHGIETVPVRRARGKPDAGLITLSIVPRIEGELRLEMRDDGNGIDTAGLLPCALRLGIANAAKATPEERLRWLLRSGFSTRTEVSEESGHGIGLAAVNNIVVALGGRLDLESSLSHGSCFSLLIPTPTGM